MTPYEIFRVGVFILGIPVVLLSTLVHRISGDKDVPLGTDLFLAIIRATTNLPLSIKRGALGFLNVDQILQSNRFRDAKQDFCKRIEHDDFAGYWIFQGALEDRSSLDDCDVVLFWIHGGAYVLGNPLMSLVQLLRINEICHSKGLKLGAFSLEYGLAPEHTFPQPFDQGLAAYKYVSQQVDPKKIVICGESAGGHLALTILDQLAKESIAKPAGALLLYPWVDLGNNGKSVVRNKKKDMLNADDLDRAVRWACGKAGPAAFADNFDFSAVRPQGHWRDVLPTKTWVGVGSHDLFADSVQDFVRHAKEDGSNITLDIWQNETHGYPAILDVLARRRYTNLKPREDASTTMKGAALIAAALLDLV